MTKFSIITPAYNIERWLPETIESVLSQAGDFEIEYIIVTNISPDRTVEIAKEYMERIDSGVYPVRCKKINMHVIELKQKAGMYVAINTGFAQATGDVYAWIPGDDTYQVGAFEAVKKVFDAFSEIEWLKGIDGTVNEKSEVTETGRCYLYNQTWLESGVYGMEAYHVGQESVFWKPSLWKKVAPFPSHFMSMGDYWLWMQMAKHARLWSMNVPVSYFRRRPDQDSKIFAERCRESMWNSRGNRRPLNGWIARLFFYPYFHVVPHRLRLVMENVYPFLFPFQSREYIDIVNGIPEKKKARSYVC